MAKCLERYNGNFCERLEGHRESHITSIYDVVVSWKINDDNTKDVQLDPNDITYEDAILRKLDEVLDYLRNDVHPLIDNALSDNSGVYIQQLQISDRVANASLLELRILVDAKTVWIEFWLDGQIVQRIPLYRKAKG